MGGYLQVSTTTGSRDDAATIARTVVESRLAACAQIVGPITSTYWWEGKIEMSEEWLCVIKTSEELYADLEDAIRAAHSYDVPEIVAVPIVNAAKSYADWLTSELRGG